MNDSLEWHFLMSQLLVVNCPIRSYLNRSRHGPALKNKNFKNILNGNRNELLKMSQDKIRSNSVKHQVAKLKKIFLCNFRKSHRIYRKTTEIELLQRERKS